MGYLSGLSELPGLSWVLAWVVSCPCSYLKVDWARWPRWLSSGSSAGAVNLSTSMWPLHVTWPSLSVAAGSKRGCLKREYSKRPKWKL